MPTCDLGNKVFVCQSSQIQKLIDGINAVSVCNATTSCPGKLVPVEVVSFGMGGTLKFQCSGCGLREVFFNSSAVGISGNRYRSTLGVALQVAFVCSGCMYAHYFRTLCLSLGMSTVREPTFFETLKLMYPHVEKLRSKQCEEAKQCMKSLGEATLGRAVTTGDAACLTKGHHSRNATYTLRNKLTNEVLYYTHMCQHGSDHGMVEYPLFKGTANAAEGHAAEDLFKQAVQEGMHVAVHWLLLLRRLGSTVQTGGC